MRKQIFTSIYPILLLCFFSIPLYAEDSDMRNTYAVIWTIDTDDVELYNNTVVTQAQETLELWKKGVIENVYLDNKSPFGDEHKGDAGRVVFFIKAETVDEAKIVLDQMPLVENSVAKYTLYPVGVLWLKQF